MAIGRTQCPQPRRPPACRRRRHEIEEAHVEPPGSEALVRNDPDRARGCRRRRARRHLGRPERPGHRPELLPAGSGDDPGPGDPRSLHIVFFIAVAIFLVVEGLIVWTVFRYRRKPGDDELPPQTHGNNLAEIVWTVVPTLIVIFLFFISWQTLNTVEAKSNAPDLHVRAVAGQFQWTFDYLRPARRRPTTRCSRCRRRSAPDGGLDLPAGKTIHFFLTSQDVIHAFYVPAFLFKRDVVPGHVNEFDFTVDGAGPTSIRGQCAELCGIGHGVDAVRRPASSPAEFQTWYDQQVAEAKATPPPPPSGEPAGSGAPPPGGGTVLNVVAKNVAFDANDLERARGPAVHDPLRQPGRGHPAQRRDPGRQRQKVEFNGRHHPGVARPRTTRSPPLTAGTYKFVCSIHPNMTGTLTVQ